MAEERSTWSGNKVIDDPKTKLHDRLTKILQMTKSSNEQEAQTAATLLQKFLTEHNLSVADLESRGRSVPGIRAEPHDLGKAAFGWKLDLADGIAEFYYCAPMVDRTNKTVQFIGRPENVEALTMLYAWVIDQIKKIATAERRKHYDTTGEHIDPLRWQLHFGEGAVERLIVRLQEMRARQQEDMSRNEYGDVTALVRHHQSEVSDWLEEHHGYRTDGKKTKKELEREKWWDKWEEDRKKEREDRDSLRLKCTMDGDMEPFYKAYPYEHPTALAKQEEAAKRQSDKWRKQEARNAKRRIGSYTREKKVDYNKMDQTDTARRAGREAASKINVQPFIGGATDKKKVGGG